MAAIAIAWCTAATRRAGSAHAAIPILVRETSVNRFPATSRLIHINDVLHSQFKLIEYTTKATKLNYGYFRNIFYFGPPKIGKMLFGKLLASNSGLDYAIIQGGDIAAMGSKAVPAIQEVFDWAETSPQGMVLYIDKVEAFMNKPSSRLLHEDKAAILNAISERACNVRSSRYLTVLASNHPEYFDWSLHKGMNEIIELKLPKQPERENFLLQHFDPAVSGLKLADFDWKKKLNQISHQLEGYSRRELLKLIFRWKTSTYATDDRVLTTEMIDRGTSEAKQEHKFYSNTRPQNLQWLWKRIYAEMNGHASVNQRININSLFTLQICYIYDSK